MGHALSPSRTLHAAWGLGVALAVWDWRRDRSEDAAAIPALEPIHEAVAALVAEKVGSPTLTAVLQAGPSLMTQGPIVFLARAGLLDDQDSPLATTPERNLLATMGPGVLWVAALLASLLSLPRLFAGDYADGTLEQIALSPYPLAALVSGKILAHWLTTGLPVAALAPLLGLQYAMDA